MTKLIKKPELLAPAGDMERLMAAVKYGADAVYLGGTMFGMRAAPANFNNEQLAEAVKYCHDRGVKVYLTCNVLPRNDELPELPDFLLNAKKCGVESYSDLADNLRVDIPASDGDVIKAGDMEFEVINLPGHTKCSVGFYFQG